VAGHKTLFKRGLRVPPLALSALCSTKGPCDGNATIVSEPRSRAIDGSQSRVTALDGVRGLAISLVLLAHVFPFQARSVPERVLLVLTSTGWIGVQLFFVLSGFLLIGILVDEKGSVFYFQRFYIRRVLRIFPIYFVFLVALSTILAIRPALGGICYWTYTANFKDLIPNCSQIEALGPLWSLSVEEQFYLLLPATIALCSRDGLVRVLIIAGTGSILLRAILVIGFNALTPAFAWTPTNLDGFAAGGLTALALRSEAGLRWLKKASPTVFLTALAFFSGLGLGNRSFGWLIQPRTSLVLGAPAVVVMSAGLIGLALTSNSVGAALSCRPLRVLGKYSYAIYLFHTPVSELVRNGIRRASHSTPPFADVIFAGLISVFLSLVMAIISWRLIEAPLLRLKARLAPRAVVELALTSPAQEGRPL
jgi:peptidoglycan/LPS O-acetylase OafA/YrhL